MNELSRLKFRCRRGMKELDVIFTRYLDRHFPNASAQEKQYLDELLQLQDPILYGMIMDIDSAPEQYRDLLTKLHHYN